MSYSTDPVLDAQRHLEDLYAAQDARDAAEFAASSDFIAACHKGDANALAGFASMVTDWDAARRAPLSSSSLKPQRYQRLHEVMAEALDYESGPALAEAMQLILNVAFGSATIQAQAPSAARALLERMSKAWGYANATVED